MDINQEKEELNRFSEAGWNIIKRKLLGCISELSDINEVDDATDITVEIKARKHAVKYLQKIIDEVDGDILQMQEEVKQADGDFLVRRG